MKIALVQGNGSDLVGGGSIQLEYDLWAKNQKDIELTHFIQVDKEELKKYNKLRLEGRELNNVIEFSIHKSSYDIFNDFDRIIVLTFPFPKNEEFNTAAIDWYKNAFKTFKKKVNKWLGIICYDYLEEVVLNNIGAIEPILYSYADKIWVNNEENPLVDYLLNCKLSIEKYRDINMDSFYIECPQFMNEEKLEWQSFFDKYPNTIYYQGRSLDWKGWDRLEILSDYLTRENENYHAIFNGLTIENKEGLDTTKFNELYETHFINQEKFSKNRYYYSMFSPQNANEITSNMMFGFYFTLLDPSNNFLPEYAFLDAIKNGTVLIVPKWYFNGGEYYKYKSTTTLISESPEDVGMIAWDPSDELSTKEVKNKINELTKNSVMYNSYRQKAYNYIVKTHGANVIIRKFLGVKNG